MINEKLNVGDYIFSPSGGLARITKINKKSYSVFRLDLGRTDNVTFNNPIRDSFWGNNHEWFKCEEPDRKALEVALKLYQIESNLQHQVDEIKKLIGKAKLFLEEIKDIGEELGID